MYENNMPKSFVYAAMVVDNFWGTKSLMAMCESTNSKKATIFKWPITFIDFHPCLSVPLCHFVATHPIQRIKSTFRQPGRTVANVNITDQARSATDVDFILVLKRPQTIASLRQDPPLDLSFWSFLTFLHHGIEEVERHLLWKFFKKIRRKSWSNVPPKLLACIRFLYKVVHKIGRLRKFNRSREIEFNFLDYLHEIWHTCSACSWLQKMPQIF